MTNEQRTTAAAIAAFYRRWLPSEILQEPTEPAHMAVADLDEMANGGEGWDDASACWALQMAVENTANYTEDGYEHPEAAELLGEEGDPIVEDAE